MVCNAWLQGPLSWVPSFSNLIIPFSPSFLQMRFPERPILYTLFFLPWRPFPPLFLLSPISSLEKLSWPPPSYLSLSLMRKIPSDQNCWFICLSRRLWVLLGRDLVTIYLLRKKKADWHSQLCHNFSCIRQGDPHEASKTKVSVQPCLSTGKNKVIVQTTKMTKHPHWLRRVTAASWPITAFLH